MMKILAIDTSTRFLCLGIHDGTKTYGYHLEVGRELSRLLAVTIQRTMDAARLKLKDVDCFACGLGPGSFTGLRTGVSCVKGMSWALNKPVVGIPSLEVIAKNAGAINKPLVAVVDAKRDLIYCGFFKNQGGQLKRTKPYGLLTLEGLLKKAPRESVFLGDAIALYQEELRRGIKGAAFLDKDAWYPQPHQLIELALERIKEKRFSNPYDLEPLYLYPKECQIKK
jgi:tRNA threonylcarbamoyladenosine biosynthesis protein TsaB